MPSWSARSLCRRTGRTVGVLLDGELDRPLDEVRVLDHRLAVDRARAALVGRRPAAARADDAGALEARLDQQRARRAARTARAARRRCRARRGCRAARARRARGASPRSAAAARPGRGSPARSPSPRRRRSGRGRARAALAAAGRRARRTAARSCRRRSARSRAARRSGAAARATLLEEAQLELVDRAVARACARAPARSVPQCSPSRGRPPRGGRRALEQPGVVAVEQQDRPVLGGADLGERLDRRAARR